MKIEFKYATIYEINLNPDGIRPSDDLVRIKIDTLNKFWLSKKEVIENSFRKITGLSSDELIICYLNTAKSFSEPLTLKISEDDDQMCDTLVHELCHVIMNQNKVGLTDGYRKFKDDFKDENRVAQIHILVHAIHYLVYTDIMPGRLQAILEHSKKPDYIRSWEIVMKIGAQNIIDTYLLKNSK